MELSPFRIWFDRLKNLAAKSNWELGEPDSYREYFDDNDSPEQTLATEMSYAEDEFDEFYKSFNNGAYAYEQ